MNSIKFITAINAESFEERLKEAVEEISYDHELVDIKYQHSHVMLSDGYNVHQNNQKFSAIIVYKIKTSREA